MQESRTAAGLPAAAPASAALPTMAELDPTRIAPRPPQFLTDHQEAELRAQARAFLEQVLANPLDAHLGDEVMKIGLDEMRAASAQNALLDKPLGRVLQNIQVGSPTNRTLIEIKAQLDLVNPSVVGRSARVARFPFLPEAITAIFSFLSRLPHADEVVKMIAERRETVGSTVNGLQEHLFMERDKVLEDAEQLKRMTENLLEIERELQRNVYLGQLIWAGIVEAMPGRPEPERQALSQLVSHLSMQVVDLQTIDNVNLQARTGAQQLIENARMIQRQIMRITTILKHAVANALAVRAAAAQQAQTMQVANDITHAIGETLQDTARAIRHNSGEMAKLSQQMLVNTEAIEHSTAEYVAMVAEYEQVRDSTEKVARGISALLTAANDKLRQSAEVLRVR